MDLDRIAYHLNIAQKEGIHGMKSRPLQRRTCSVHSKALFPSIGSPCMRGGRMRRSQLDQAFVIGHMLQVLTRFGWVSRVKMHIIVIVKFIGLLSQHIVQSYFRNP